MWRKSSHSTYNGNCVEASARWLKSSYSANGNCVEAAGDFRRATRCNGGACVEVATAGSVRVRDSKDPGGPVLAFSRAEWEDFTSRLKSG